MINLVTVSSGWILQKIAERIAASQPTVFSVSHTSSQTVTANVYIDMQNCFLGKSKTIDIGVFTHLHKNSLSDFQPRYRLCDHIIHMSSRYLKLFSQVYPQERMSVCLPVDVSSFKMKKDKIGIFQRGGWEGKGHDFMKQVARCQQSTKFEFLLVGGGWNDIAEEFKNHGIKCTHIPDESYDKYNELYSSVDYVLIPSLWEGGPISIAEALACGIPVISSDVGFANTDIDVDYIYPPGDIESLCLIFNKLIKARCDRRERVDKFSYAKFGQHIIDVISELERK